MNSNSWRRPAVPGHCKGSLRPQETLSPAGQRGSGVRPSLRGTKGNGARGLETGRSSPGPLLQPGLRPRGSASTRELVLSYFTACALEPHILSGASCLPSSWCQGLRWQNTGLELHSVHRAGLCYHKGHATWSTYVPCHNAAIKSLLSSSSIASCCCAASRQQAVAQVAGSLPCIRKEPWSSWPSASV